MLTMLGLDEVGGGLGLLAEACANAGSARVAGVHHLDGDGAAERLVDGLVDVGHAAGADLLGHAVPAAEYQFFHVEPPCSFTCGNDSPLPTF